ncbi:MAG: deoxyribodipyrimidine photo-lyase [Actinomycetes bacterium]|jgi:deoxyribodipyrimidine photo-lyase
MPRVMWFRRDLRLADNPALLEATATGAAIPLFVFDPRLWGASGSVRQAYLLRSLAAFQESLNGQLVIRCGDPVTVVPEIARECGAESVHIAADFGPYGAQRDDAVAVALGEVQLVRTGSPYAVAPGRILKDDGTAYRVYTPFYKAWMKHGWRAPAEDADVSAISAADLASDAWPSEPDLDGIVLPPAGERAAWATWESFRHARLASYADQRNLPGIDGTSTLSHHLKYGEVHPRSLLAELGESDEVFRKEICWREFYADILAQRPDSVSRSLDARYDENMRWASGPDADALFEAWSLGRTGYPFVDAGMRQLLAEGWMHNRVRMVVASFFVKDLHLPWQRGAQYFMQLLRDGDIASNTHGWQWTAGCGTDASPFYRVFNPILQGEKFDPDGAYVRRYIPELAHLSGAKAHEPWDCLDGYAQGYPERIVDHAVERDVALADFARIKR